METMQRLGTYAHTVCLSCTMHVIFGHLWGQLAIPVLCRVGFDRHILISCWHGSLPEISAIGLSCNGRGGQVIAN